MRIQRLRVNCPAQRGQSGGQVAARTAGVDACMKKGRRAKRVCLHLSDMLRLRKLPTCISNRRTLYRKVRMDETGNPSLDSWSVLPLSADVTGNLAIVSRAILRKNFELDSLSAQPDATVYPITSSIRECRILSAQRHRSIAFHQTTFSHSLNVILAHSRRRHQRVPKSRGSLAAATDQ